MRCFFSRSTFSLLNHILEGKDYVDLQIYQKLSDQIKMQNKLIIIGKRQNYV
jgi:hypothetical protein